MFETGINQYQNFCDGKYTNYLVYNNDFCNSKIMDDKNYLPDFVIKNIDDINNLPDNTKLYIIYEYYVNGFRYRRASEKSFNKEEIKERFNHNCKIFYWTCEPFLSKDSFPIFEEKLNDKNFIYKIKKAFK